MCYLTSHSDGKTDYCEIYVEELNNFVSCLQPFKK